MAHSPEFVELENIGRLKAEIPDLVGKCIEQGFTITEIATALQTSRSQVHRHAHKSLRRLQHSYRTE